MNEKQIVKAIDTLDKDIALLKEKLKTATEASAEVIQKSLDELLRKRKRYAGELVGNSDLKHQKGDRIQVDDRWGIVEGAYFKVVLLNKDGEETKQVRYIEIE